MTTVFFYGLFMDKDLLHVKGLNPQRQRLAYLDDYELVIGARATLAPKSGARSYGAVMDLPQGELNALYAGDGVEDYLPQAVLANSMQGGEIEAIACILPLSMTSGTNSKYAKQLIDVARKLGLPDHYVEEISKWI